jgi:RNA binding exosome subunit
MEDPTERLRAVGQAEFRANEREWDRLKQLADRILDSMQYHMTQMDNWNLYLGSLAAPQGDNVIQLRPDRQEPK